MANDRAQRNRYSRQVMFPGIGEAGQRKLAAGRAVVVGCGALGSNIAGLLVRAGVGRVRVVDRDFIEYHNLPRQVLFDEDDYQNQLPKAVAAARHLRRINSTTAVEGIVADVNATNIEELCRDAGVILDGLDNFETRFLINDAALKLNIPWVYGAAVASQGMTMTVLPGRSACFRCLFAALPEPGTTPTCETAGIVGTVPAVIGALQATEAIKLLVGAPDINPGLTVLDVWSNMFRNVTVAPRADCPACRGKYEFLEKAFDIRTTSFCGQSRAIQVVDRRLREVSLAALAERLEQAGKVTVNEFLLRLELDDHEIIVFPDGRAIIRNTTDEALARELYRKYIASAQE